MKRLKTCVRRLCYIGLIGATVFLAYLRMGKDFTKEIRTGKLCYTTAGWVNLGHANPAGVKVFIEDLRRHWKASEGAPFQVTYGQQMTGRYFCAIMVQARIERTYRVAPVMNEQELDRIAWGIFREVTEAFETMQGSFPNAIDASSQGSSYRDGDLLGNRNAFYQALRGYSDQQIHAWIQPMSVEASLQRFHQGSFPKNYRWEVAPALLAGPLDVIPHDADWFSAHAHQLSETESWFQIQWIGFKRSTSKHDTVIKTDLQAMRN